MMWIQLAFDQSPYVSNAISSLVREALLGAVLTGVVVLIFLRDWRGAIIVVANIPFALATAVLALWATGQTINIMTLGGLALAVGVLVDEATVEVENIHTQLPPGTSRAQAVVEACRRTIIARLLSMLCVLAVFVPSFFMSGVGRQLFVPLSLAVGFAMIASYLLSSSLVPVFAIWIMKEAHGREESVGFFGKVHSRYERFLAYVEERRWRFVLGYFGVAAVILVLVVPHIGTEIFPDPNGPVLRLRLKAPIGTRIEETEPMAIHALDLIRRTVGPQNVDITTDYVGVQPSSYPVNLIHLFTSGPEEVLMQVQLRKSHPDDERLREDLRAAFKREMPQLQLSFEAGGIISQVMSFGSPTPVEIDVQGVDLDQNYAYLSRIEAELHKLSFLRDVSVVQQPETYVGHIVRGVSVPFHIAAQPGKNYTAKISRIASALDPQNRTMMVELDAYNKDGTLAPGMYPTVDWPVSSAQPQLVVPSTSVVTTTERIFVIISLNGKAHWVNVRKGPVFGDQVAIRGEIKPGEKVVKRASDEIREGTPIP